MGWRTHTLSGGSHEFRGPFNGTYPVRGILITGEGVYHDPSSGDRGDTPVATGFRCVVKTLNTHINSERGKRVWLCRILPRVNAMPGTRKYTASSSPA